MCKRPVSGIFFPRNTRFLVIPSRTIKGERKENDESGTRCRDFDTTSYPPISRVSLGKEHWSPDHFPREPPTTYTIFRVVPLLTSVPRGLRHLLSWDSTRTTPLSFVVSLSKLFLDSHFRTGDPPPCLERKTLTVLSHELFCFSFFISRRFPKIVLGLRVSYSFTGHILNQ